MADDVKILVGVELTADEQASAERIKAQLPRISRLINEGSAIKVGVLLDESGIKAQAQRYASQVSTAMKSHRIDVPVNLNTDSVAALRDTLAKLKVNPDMARQMTSQLDAMKVKVDQVSGSWSTTTDGAEALLNVTIRGTDQMGRSVAVMQRLNAETGELTTRLTSVSANYKQQEQAEARLAAQAQKDNQNRIAWLIQQDDLLTKIRNSYTGATSAKPILNPENLTELETTYQNIRELLNGLISSTGALDNEQKAQISSQIAGLQQLTEQYRQADYIANQLRTKDIGTVKQEQLTSLNTFEEKLRASGMLTEEFQKTIEQLRGQIAQAFTPKEITSFLNNFGNLQNSAKLFEEKLRNVNSIYTQIMSVEKRMTGIQVQMMGLDPEKNAEQRAALDDQLALLMQQRQELESQLVPYSNILTYAQGVTQVEQARRENMMSVEAAEAKLADRAREADAAFQKMPTTMANLEAQFRAVNEPSEALLRMMEELRQITMSYNAEMSDEEKVSSFTRMQELIRGCSKEMRELNKASRSSTADFKFTTDLEKANADLATMKRQWSAFKTDPGLRGQVAQLEAGLTRIRTRDDLTRWRAQFATLKSEIRAAGKNCLTLADTLKNNFQKVTQWITATTLLFRAFRVIRSAISTITALDTAMIDLRKTTDATETEYRAFYRTANDTAKQLGVTTEEVIAQTAEWSRLGYTLEESAKLAENSAIFKAISPGMDIQLATDGLVSIIKAFKIDVDESMDGIISKVNSVGNAFAVSNDDIVNALTRSSSAMSAANNTFDETVALATAAIEITRNADSVGNGLKTLSMRIRGDFAFAPCVQKCA